MESLTLTEPDDWHIHLRDGAALETTVPAVSAQFARAIVMPNLKPPVVSVDDARRYQARIMNALPEGVSFEPLMTLYLTDETPASEIARAASAGVKALKLYPAGATTNSDAGVTDLDRVAETLEAMSTYGLPLLVHGEVTRDEVDIFDRERVFLEDVLEPLLKRHEGLKVVLEHITTKEAAAFVAEGPARLGATITAHHLLENRNAMLVGGIKPHYYCLPVLKRERDREALLKAATSGDPSFFLGTDSAPHAVDAKESSCGCAGCYTAHAALELYAEAFERVDALDRLEGFASFHGPDFYGLPRNSGRVTLRRRVWYGEVEPFGDGGQLRPFRLETPLQWKSTRDGSS